VEDVYEHESFKEVVSEGFKPNVGVPPHEYEMTMAYRVFMFARFDTKGAVSLQHYESEMNRVRFPKGLQLQNIPFKWVRDGAREVIDFHARRDRVQQPTSSRVSQLEAAPARPPSVNVSGAGSLVVVGGRSHLPRYTASATATADSTTTTATTVNAEDKTRSDTRNNTPSTNNPAADLSSAWSVCADINIAALPLSTADKAKTATPQGWSERGSFLHQEGNVRTTKHLPEWSMDWSASNGIENPNLPVTPAKAKHASAGPSAEPERDCYPHPQTNILPGLSIYDE
jgi:hypothetical protein